MLHQHDALPEVAAPDPRVDALRAGVRQPDRGDDGAQEREGVRQHQRLEEVPVAAVAAAGADEAEEGGEGGGGDERGDDGEVPGDVEFVDEVVQPARA